MVMSRVRIFDIIPLLTQPSQIVCGYIGDENHGFPRGIRHGVKFLMVPMWHQTWGKSFDGSHVASEMG